MYHYKKKTANKLNLKIIYSSQYRIKYKHIGEEEYFSYGVNKATNRSRLILF